MPGFTIMELIIVVIIIGVLAAIALPSYRIQTLKMRNQEAVRYLMAVWGAQKDYHREHGYYDTGTPDPDFDVDIPLSLKYFVVKITGAVPQAPCDGGPPVPSVGVALQTPLPGGVTPYVLFVTEDGRILCKEGPCSNAPLCKQMGFPDW